MAKKTRLKCWVKLAVLIVLLIIAYNLMINFSDYRVDFYKLNQTYEIEDTNNEIILQGNYGIEQTNELSVAFWVKPQTFDFNESNYIQLLKYGDDDNNTQWEFRLYDIDSSKSKKYSFNIFDNIKKKSLESTTLGNETINESIFILSTIDANFTSIYRNGVLIDKDLYTNYNFTQNNYSLKINPIVDKVTIYNKTLTQSEIKSIYEEQKQLFE